MADRRSKGGAAVAGAARTRRDAPTPRSRGGVWVQRVAGAALGVLALSVPSAYATHERDDAEMDYVDPAFPDAFCKGPNRFMSCCPDAVSSTVFLPAIPYEYMWGREMRACLYIMGLLWCFLGVSVLSDTFMAGIERITEGTHQVKRKRKNPDGTQVMENGEPVIDTVDELIWNPAVANLSLMALGSSTPEILLGIIEIMGGGFYAGALGPGTVVGSAAFNLYVITGICMIALEDNEVRKVEGVTVFCITSFSSLFAYVWLGVILIFISPDVVELWEALLTLAFMPLLLLIVWCADNEWFLKPSGGATVHPDEEEAVTAEGDGTEGGEAGPSASSASKTASMMMGRRLSTASNEGHDLGRVAKVSYLAHRRAIAAKTSGAAKKGLESVKNTIPGQEEQKNMSAMMKLAHQESFAILTHTTFHFRSASSAFPKSYGCAQVSIVRGGKGGVEAKIRVQTRDGNVISPGAFDKFDQIVTFGPMDAEKVVEIPFKTDYQWHQNSFFEVVLVPVDTTVTQVDERSSKTIVTVVSEDEGSNNITWSSQVASFFSTDSAAILLMQQAHGVEVPTHVRVVTKSGSAKDGVDFVGLETNLEFRPFETAKTIKVQLVPRRKSDEVKKSSEFTVCMWELSESGNKVGEEKMVTVSIIHSTTGGAAPPEEEEEEQKEVSWGGQFSEALNVNGGSDLEDASISDCIMHWMSIGWKVMAATTPPASYYGGYACFWWALSLIGLTTAIIGDLASIFGCLCNLKDEVTAITIVALGTSLPDTFASMLAIKADDTADNAIGNVTGSNSVNVFLGLGIPWSMAAIYWSSMAGDMPAVWHDLYKPIGEGGQGLVKESIYLQYKETGAFVYPANNLGFSLVVFCILTIVAFLLLFLRRKFLGAEFGGGKILNRISAVAFISLWCTYVMVYSLQVYGYYDNPFAS